MTTGEYLVAHSTLGSGSALAHLLALQTGGGGTVFASRFTVIAGSDSTTVTRKTKRPALPDPIATRPDAEPSRTGRNAYAVRVVPTAYPRTAADELTVTTRKQQSVVASAHTETAVINRKRKAP